MPNLPPSPPAYFPIALWWKTEAILAEAVRRFPKQTQILESCKYVISEITPHVCAAVKAGTLGPMLALTDDGMGDVLRALIYNYYHCTQDDGRGFRLKQAAMNSEEWVRLRREIAASTAQPKLTDRELKIWEVIQRGVRGSTYCRELGNSGIAPLQSGIWKGCPRKYESAYLQGEPWRHRIQDEKSKIRRKAELAGLAKLASE